MQNVTTIVNNALDNAIASAMTSGSLVTPVVMVSGPGMGVLTELRENAAGRGFDVRDVRVGHIDPHDARPLPVLRGHGRVEFAPLSIDFLRAGFESGDRMLVLLDEAVANGPGVAAAIMAQAAREAKAQTVVVLHVRPGDEQAAEDAIAQGLGLLPDRIRNRFVTFEQVDPYDAFMAYARERGLDADVVAFLDQRGDLAGANPRAWSHFSALRAADEFGGLEQRTMDLIAGNALGAEPAAAFATWMKEARQTNA